MFVRFSFVILITALCFALQHPAAIAQERYEEVEAFLEPYQKIDVSTVETGIIRSIQVREGDWVKKGDILVKLDREVLMKSLAVSIEESKSMGNITVATAELEMQEARYRKLQTLLERGHGRENEVDRAESDVKAARGRLLRAEEEIAIKLSEIEQIRAKISARDVVSPIDGIVVEILRRPGEAVSPNAAELVTVVNIDQLKCVFDVPRKNAKRIVAKKKIKLQLDSGKMIAGMVEWKCPILNAESETTKVIVRVDNPNHIYTSGEYCILKPNAEQFADADDTESKPKTVSFQK